MKPPVVAVSLALLVLTAHAADKPRTIEGTIKEYECGDNCYLTIVDSKGDEHTGLCAAPQCKTWNDLGKMPRDQKQRNVRVTVGRRAQLNSAGEVMGQSDAFTKIDFLR